MSLLPTIKKAIRRFLLIDFFTGMKVTFASQHPAELVTEQYPQERPALAERYRGQPRMAVNPDTGKTLCTACELCALACPEKLIKISSERDPVTKRKKLINFTYDVSRCMFCGLCVEACNFECLELTQDYEMALYSRDGMVLDRERLERGPEPAVYKR